MIVDWSVEGRNRRIDVRTHGRLEATLKLPGLSVQRVQVAQSGGVKALPSIPMQPGTELVVLFDGVKVVVIVEEVQG